MNNRFIDSRTGEIVHQTKVAGKAFDWFPDERGVLFGRGGRGIWRIGDTSGLSYQECGLLHKIAFLVGEDGMMPSTPRMAKLCDLSERQMTIRLIKLFKAGAVAKYGPYYLNPAVIFTGKQLSPALYSLFKGDLDVLLTDRVIAKYTSLLTGK